MAPMSTLLLLCLCLSATIVLLAPPCAASTDFVIYSNPPSVVLPGQTLFYDLTPQGIPYGPISLHMQTDCNLVVYFKGQLSWATNTTGKGSGCYLTVDNYGEAIVQSNLHDPVWRSGVRSKTPGDHLLLMQWNGGLASYGPPIWSSGNAGQLIKVAADNHTTDYIFYSYSILTVGVNITYAYKNWELRLLDDCNLVLRNTLNGEVKWQTNTYSPYYNCFLTLDDRGELFIKQNRREIIWRSGVAGPSNLYVLVLRYDGTLHVLGPQVWTSKPFW